MTWGPDASDTSAAWHVLLSLGGTGALYLSAGETITRSTQGASRVWQALPMDLGPIEEEFSDGLIRAPRIGSYTVEITDDDQGTLQAWYENNDGALGRKVSIWASDDDATTAELVFDGVIDEPSDAVFDYSTKVLELRVMDRRTSEDQNVPPNTLDPDNPDYEYIDDAWKGRPIPILYGDWSEGRVHHSGSMRRPVIEAVAIDTGVHRGVGQYAMRFQVCDPGTNGIAYIGDRVWIKYGNSAAHGSEWSWMNTSSIDLDTSCFSVSTTEIEAQSYRYQIGDRFFVYCKGNADGAGNVIENPLLILRDLWNNYASPVTENNDWFDSFSTEYLHFSGSRARARLVDQEPLIDVSDRLCTEFNMIWGVKPEESGGVWDTVYWARRFDPWNTSGNATPTADYRPAWGSISSEPIIKPAETDLYADRLRVLYRYHPLLEIWSKLKEANVSGLKYLPWNPGGAGYVTREIETTWLWRKADAYRLIDQQALLYSRKRLVWEFPAWGWPMNVYLGDAVQWQSTNDNDARRGIVIGRRVDLQSGECELTVLDCSDRVEYYARWTSDTEDVYDDQDTDGKRIWGFWTDEDGLCDPPDSTSDDSHWI
ncbi:MAG: hypothetical protein P9M14_13545 [Candidatus Alcyoniella australis]|nr:hypothetical protein [Candidatus Alcyoniella australis]